MNTRSTRDFSDQPFENHFKSDISYFLGFCTTLNSQPDFKRTCTLRQCCSIDLCAYVKTDQAFFLSSAKRCDNGLKGGAWSLRRGELKGSSPTPFWPSAASRSKIRTPEYVRVCVVHVLTESVTVYF